MDINGYMKIMKLIVLKMKYGKKLELIIILCQIMVELKKKKK